MLMTACRLGARMTTVRCMRWLLLATLWRSVYNLKIRCSSTYMIFITCFC